MQAKDKRYFGILRYEHIFPIQEWRNQQRDILRNQGMITRNHQIKWFAALKKDKRQRLFAILDGGAKDKKLIGYCGLTHIDQANRRAEISFLVDPLRRKNSALYRTDMTCALRHLCNYAFKKLRLKKVFTETYEFRKKHIRILEDFGLRREGVLRAHLLYKGRFYHTLVHSLLKEEFIK